jgi:hypothetical protein
MTEFILCVMIPFKQSAKKDSKEEKGKKNIGILSHPHLRGK